ncbi:MAG: hypothetical protein GEU88_01995 [Solirubrobacterales bacterium]|nr:hypothetical protein [Solirubrobacterales bacterium]
MGDARLLIRCDCAPRASEHDLDRWLAQRVRGLSAVAATLYRAGAGRRAGGCERASDAERARAWVIELGDGDAEPAQFSELLGEMRLLGLRPTVFRDDPR